jgi:formylglycine-generating enzyme required for sulfatase activity
MPQVLAGHYQIERKLSEGGFGITYLARDIHRPGHPLCVVKQLKLQFNNPQGLKVAKRLFDQEGEILEELGNHDQIPRLLAFVTEGGQFYLVQEYIQGHELRQEIQPGKPWSEEQVLKLLEDMLIPLKFVHQKQVIHRDIKPDNLMRRDGDNKLVLIDFGAVKQELSQITPTGGTVFTIAIGTPGYMPTEQAVGKPKLASDIYAVGMTAIEALTGKSPSQFKDDPDTLEVIWQPFAPHASRGLKRVLQKMVYQHFRQRYKSAKEALQEVKELRGGTVLPSPTPPPRPTVASNNPTRRRVIQGVGLVGMGVVGSLFARSLMDGWEPETSFEPEIVPEPEPSPEPEPVVEPEPEPEPEPEEPQLPIFRFEVVTVNRRGEIVAQEEREAQYFQENLGEGIFLDMVAIPGGTFLMGSPPDEEQRRDTEGPQHSVTVQPFYMGKFEVTQAQWRRVASFPQVNRALDSNPSYFKGENLPVERVSWYDCEEFCARLSRYTGNSYRLPSEAEWEYGCRAGTTTPFHFGETLTTNLANYDGSTDYRYADEPKGEYRQTTTPVGSFPPNGFGLYDMHGNLWEWCADHWHDNYNNAPTDGSIWLSSDESSRRLFRGGSWNDSSDNCRSRYRVSLAADNRSGFYGFRVVCPLAMTT